MKSVPVLHTDRCTLSAITQSDIPVLRGILDDSETQRFLPELCEEFQTEESLRKFVESFDKYIFQNEGILWGIRKDNTLIGFIAIMDMPDNPTIFYAMHPDFRNRRYMKECLTATMQFVKDCEACQGLQTEVYQDNIISRKLLNDMGFRHYSTDDKKVCYMQ